MARISSGKKSRPHRENGLEPILEDGHIIFGNEQLELDEIVIDKEIGRGANGVVYQAHDRLLERRVAVKVWIEKQRDRRDKKLQGLAEARKIASLQHRRVATLFHAGIHAGRFPYAVMEYVPGITLKERLAEPIELVERSRIWSQISSALRYAYGIGIYHGDLHPGNVLIHDRAVKVLDFGTSLFVPQHHVAKSREARLLRRLFLSVYPDVASEVIGCAADAVIDKPEIVLAHTVTAAEYVNREGILANLTKSLDKDDYDLESALGNVAYLIASAPFLSLNGILARLDRIGLPEAYTKVLLDRCQLYSEMSLRPASGEGMEWTPDFDRTAELMHSDALLSLRTCQVRHLDEYSTDPKSYVLEHVYDSDS